ncbi:hypothetical protein BJV82DRAFT_627822 [Fennellomyces sp. T-0311]|nr:hypothetical protein BJV82DRAFT_627822 [Fennellomyces sp. T-0311]
MADHDSGHRPVFICHLIPYTKSIHEASNRQVRKLPSIERSGLSKVSINGIVVQSENRLNARNKERNIWLDDSTGIIRVLLSSRLCKRPDITQLVLSASVSIFGRVEWLANGEALIQCGGFHVDYDPVREIYHWLKVMEANKVEESSSDESQQPSSGSSGRPIVSRFQSLLSQPSPTAPQNPSNSNNDNFLDDFDSQTFNWSPDHPFASSTPIQHRFQQIANDNGNNSIHEGSPLRYPVQRTTSAEEDDDFGFDDDSALNDFDLSAFEQKELQPRK